MTGRECRGRQKQRPSESAEAERESRLEPGVGAEPESRPTKAGADRECRGRRKEDRDGVSESGQGTEAVRSCRSAVDVAEVGGLGRRWGRKLARGQRP